jgi:GT2 family glycosyltransferase
VARAGPPEIATAPTVGIILVTYYGANHLERLHESVRRLDYPPTRFWLTVVENGPDRAAWRWFAEHAPQVRVILTGGNRGYAGGVALGMQETLARRADYVGVMTQDTVLDPGWLRELVAVAQAHPGAGAIQPKILRGDGAGGTVINSWGNELHFLGVGFCGGDGRPDRPLEVRAVPYASGAGVLYRSSVLEVVGILDPSLFMYHEDTDLSWRMRLAGYDILVAPRAVMYHDYRFHGSVEKFYYIERNRLINLLTHYRLRTLAVIAPALAVFEALMLMYAARSRWLWKRLAVYGFFLRPDTWRYLRAKRRQIQSIRRAPDRAVAAHLTGRIDVPVFDTLLLHRVVNPLFEGYWTAVRRVIRW